VGTTVVRGVRFRGLARRALPVMLGLLGACNCHTVPAEVDGGKGDSGILDGGDAGACGGDGQQCLGGVCVSGACRVGCFIGSFRTPGSDNPTNGAQCCNPALSQIGWTPRFLDGGRYSVGSTLPFALASADFNGDGKSDLVVLAPDAITVMLATGQGFSSSAIPLPATLSNPVGGQSVVTRRLSPTGPPDILVADNTFLVVFSNDGHGGFVAGDHFDTDPDGGSSLQSLALGNFSGDQAPGVAVASWNLSDGSSRVIVFRSASDGGLLETPSALSSTHPIISIQALVFGPSPLASFVTTGGIGYPERVDGWGVFVDGVMDVFFNQGPQFSDIFQLHFGAQLASGEFDSDGIPDLATTELSSIGILAGQSDGTFLGNGSVDLRPVLPADGGAGAIGIMAADFNGDGRDDLVSGLFGAGLVALAVQSPDGGFSGPWVFETTPRPLALSVGDFNGDGAKDVAIIDPLTDGGPALFILVNGCP
jgi:FG-GAP-like repeat/FG-GAP repeat